MLTQNKIFNHQFAVVRKLSSGSFGIVFIGMDQIAKQEVAIKVEKSENEDVRSIDREVLILKRLNGIDGIPKLLWAGQEQGYNVIVMQLLGKDLAFHFKQLKKFTLKTTLLIGIQLIDVLEKLHSQGVVHRDMKPENIVLGTGKDSGKIYLIDFGISKFYKDTNNKHIEQKAFLGTTRYASIAAHFGHELGRKDDLESMMYILLYFIRGQLPWQNMQNVTEEERTKKVGEMKLLLQNEIFRDQPTEFQKIFDYIRKLQFKSEPNYKMITFELKKAAESLKLNLDGYYDWSEIRSSTHYDSLIPHNSFEMKKSIEKQLSGIFNQQNSANFLAPPLQFSSRNTLVIRDENKKQTVASIQGSVLCQSINPCYSPSRKCSDDNQDNETDLFSYQGNEFIQKDNVLYHQYNKLKGFGKKQHHILIFKLQFNFQFDTSQVIDLFQSYICLFYYQFQLNKLNGQFFDANEKLWYNKANFSSSSNQLKFQKIEAFSRKISKEMNERKFKKTREQFRLPHLLQDNLQETFNFQDLDFEEEEMYHIKNVEQLEVELQEFYEQLL